jgi:hypothetical protein
LWNSASSIARATQRSIARLKNRLKPHRRQCWAIPPKANNAFVAATKDVLAVYTRPHDPERVLVCLDETSKQLIAETRVPIPMKPGRAARIDYEYERNGTANLFMLFAPLEGWRHIKVTDRRTAIDYAHVLKDLADVPGQVQNRQLRGNARRLLGQQPHSLKRLPNISLAYAATASRANRPHRLLQGWEALLRLLGRERRRRSTGAAPQKQDRPPRLAQAVLLRRLSHSKSG